ncbi:hypothetical protein [Foetidibacter luteolus]|uniref:hypothetical protein n=1 Tax=Foetidibacter luteolus TaxID=2608880 RepID=UPI00129B4CE9|nr:hypothetical protein [Foetidibacter luteolus]
MKKLFIAAAMLVAVSTAAVAAGTSTNSKAFKSFSTEFKDAKNVTWKTGEGYIKASFVWNDFNMETFYNEEGELIGTSRAVTLNALPVKALKTINTKYAGYTATEAIEFDSVQDGVSYYVSEVKDNERVVLKIYSSGEVTVYKKEVK